MDSASIEKHLTRASQLATLLDSQFTVLGIPIGLDPIIGLFPGGGDLVGLILSTYLLYIAEELNLPADKKRRMIFNILFDFVIGLLPIIGDLADFFYRSNQMNLEILLEHHQKKTS